MHTNLIACEHCTGDMFCNEECMKRGNLHAKECGIELLDAMTKLILRSIVIGMESFDSIEELMRFVEEAVVDNPSKEIPISTVDAKSKYRLFLQLNKCDINGLGSFVAFIVAAGNTYRSISTVPCIKNSFDSKEKQRFLMHLTSHLAIVWKSNAISDVGKESDSSELFLTFSLFNHQCASNLHNFEITNSICITQRPIKKGEQLFVSYIPDEWPNRREYLHNKFGFWCNCAKCEPQNLSRQQLNAIILDPDFQFICNHYKDKSNEDRMELRNRCIIFLDKFGCSPLSDGWDLAFEIFQLMNVLIFWPNQ